MNSSEIRMVWLAVRTPICDLRLYYLWRKFLNSDPRAQKTQINHKRQHLHLETTAIIVILTSIKFKPHLLDSIIHLPS